jgi:hypothetical protein
MFKICVFILVLINVGVQRTSLLSRKTEYEKSKNQRRSVRWDGNSYVEDLKLSE